MEEEEEAKGKSNDEKQRVSIAYFDHSADNFLSYFNSITSLCRLPTKESFKQSEIDRYSSMITFLKEWKSLVYQPKSVKFVYQTGSGKFKDEFTSLPQFSSAAIPKIERSPDEARRLVGSDYVLNAGGLVWAFDWCPRDSVKHDSSIQCEYLAVATHPPGSNTHKIGLPLFGRGVIQIWCLLTLRENMDFSQVAKGKCKTKSAQKPLYDSEGKEVTKRPRGRPRKTSTNEDDQNGLKETIPKRLKGQLRKEQILDLTSEKQSFVKPRGRPRKRASPSINDSDDKMDSTPSNNLILGTDEYTAYANNSEGAAMGIPASGYSNREIESVASRPRGRPRKNLSSSVDKCFSVGYSSTPSPSGEFGMSSKVLVALTDSSDLNGSSSVKRPRGRPRKEMKATLNRCVQTSNSEPGEKISAFPTSRGPGTFSEDMEFLPIFNGHLDSSVNNDRESSRRGPITNVNEFNENAESLPILNGNLDLSEKNHRGRPAKGLGEAVKECDIVSVSELGEETFLTTSRQPGISCENIDSVPALKLIGNSGLFSKRGRGRPKKGSKLRGRPKKGSGLTTDMCTQPPRFELGDTRSDSVLREPGSTSENVESQPGVSDLYDKRESSGIDFTVDSFVLPTSQEEALSKNFLACSFPADSKGNLESFGTDKRGRQIKKPRKDVKCCVQITRGTLEADLSTVSAPRGLDILREEVPALPAIPDSNYVVKHKELAETVALTYNYKNKGEMVLSGEVAQEMPPLSKDTSLPKLVLCLGHMGKVAWDLKWRPSNANELGEKHHMGYLAVLLGNGCLEVWEIPLPGMVHILYTSCGKEGIDPRFLKLKPVFQCSKVKFGDNQSIPLTLEWSTAAPHDLLLAGCHDGTVALWKFSKQHSYQEIKPLLCFSADSAPIRALAWAPDERDEENTNLIVTAGHEGLRFWDLRDPYRPLCDADPLQMQKVILSLDWLKEPRCLICSCDDGKARMISLCKVANDVPVTGERPVIAKQPQVHCISCSTSAVWSIQVSRTTGVTSYCSADGSACCFQLTTKAVEKDPSRYREPHFLCGSFTKEDEVLKVNSPLSNDSMPRTPSTTKQCGDATQTLSLGLTDDPATSNKKTSSKQSGKNETGGSRRRCEKSFMRLAAEATAKEFNKSDGLAEKILELPPKDVALHRVRWNMNRGSGRWLCYGGAAGIIRCQAISLPAIE